MVLFCEASCRLKYFCTMIKAEYALLFGLELFLVLGTIHIEAFGDSLLVVQQISIGYQCFEESLPFYLVVCLDLKFTMGCFIFFIYLDRTSGEGWHSKHMATMVVMVYCTSINSRWLLLPT